MKKLLLLTLTLLGSTGAQAQNIMDSGDLKGILAKGSR